MNGCDIKMIRVIDVALSSIALLGFLPLLLLVCGFLKFTGEGDVVFVQERVGKDHRKFKLYKFITMRRNSENVGTATITMDHDPRVFPVGRFLRRTKINELPQLINVIRGDMSLVGPRPLTPECFASFPRDLEAKIVGMKPGLSGIGSIIFRNEEEMLSGDHGTLDFYDKVIAPYKAEVEAWYAENFNLKTYFEIIFVTIFVVIFPESRLVWKIFKGLPQPPKNLMSLLNYC
jgi:lipopolysaccharide/colanic/teichoic acid biosynthesis glycosyltransferase